MVRLIAALLMALVVCTLTAARAPGLKLWVTGWEKPVDGEDRAVVDRVIRSPWVTGWEKPVDPSGVCRFRTDGDKLTLTVPGKDQVLDVVGSRLHAPRLLRQVKGDFSVQVRVDGNFRLHGDGFRRAGLLLTDGKTFLRLERSAHRKAGAIVGSVRAGHHVLGQPGGGVAENTDVPLDRAGYLRLERQKDLVRISYSEDGDKWKLLLPLGWTIPESLQIGVVAETTDAGEFKPVFDKLRLSSPGQ